MSSLSPYDTARAKFADAWRNRAVSLKAAAFALVGVINSAVDYCVFLLARAVLERSVAALAVFVWLADWCRCGEPEAVLLIAANMTSWIVAVSVSYVLNSSITFAAEFGTQIALAPLSDFRRLRHRRIDRQYGDAGRCRGNSAAAGLAGEGRRHPGKLRRQFLAVAFRGVSRPRQVENLTVASSARSPGHSRQRSLFNDG